MTQATIEAEPLTKDAINPVSILSVLSTAITSGISGFYALLRENRHFALPFINGLLGDKFGAGSLVPEIPMTFREGGVNLTLPEIEEKIKRHKGCVLIFVHGLMCDDEIWVGESGQHKVYGSSLEAENVACLYLRYNTGHEIAGNGKRLNHIIQELHACMKNELKEISIIGHSMGGLVVQSALYHAHLNKNDYTEKISNVFLMGVPAGGAWLERSVAATTDILTTLSLGLLARIAREIIDLRSQGIKDLREKQEPMLMNLHEHITYHIIAATLTKDEKSFIAKHFGDGMVGHDSISTLARENPIGNKMVFKTFTGVGHLEMLSRPEIISYIKESL